MAESPRLVVWTPSEMILDADPVEWVHVELAQDRNLTIWPGHLPLLGESRTAPLSYALSGMVHSIDLPDGIVQVLGRVVTLYLGSTLEEQTEGQNTPADCFERLTESVTPSPQASVDGG